VWIFPGERRRFALVGVYGQSLYVDPELKLVMVQTGANATAEAGKTTLGARASSHTQSARPRRDRANFVPASGGPAGWPGRRDE
jgi:CubicO group peptidase (beta-lactamase class C family)